MCLRNLAIPSGFGLFPLTIQPLPPTVTGYISRDCTEDLFDPSAFSRREHVIFFRGPSIISPSKQLTVDHQCQQALVSRTYPFDTLSCQAVEAHIIIWPGPGRVTSKWANVVHWNRRRESTKPRTFTGWADIGHPKCFVTPVDLHTR